MKGGQRTGPRILAANKQRHCFGGKSRKGRQSTHEAGNNKEPSLRRDRRVIGKIRDRDADEIAADEIRGERSQRQCGEEWVEFNGERPTQARAETGSAEHGQKRIYPHESPFRLAARIVAIAMRTSLCMGIKKPLPCRVQGRGHQLTCSG